MLTTGKPPPSEWRFQLPLFHTPGTNTETRIAQSTDHYYLKSGGGGGEGDGVCRKFARKISFPDHQLRGIGGPMHHLGTRGQVTFSSTTCMGFRRITFLCSNILVYNECTHNLYLCKPSEYYLYYTRRKHDLRIMTY